MKKKREKYYTIKLELILFVLYACRRSTHPTLLAAVEIRTHVRMYSSNVEYSIQIENRMFLISDHGKNDVQSYENS